MKLIQLISEQTVQNLLPILRMKPSRLIHLVTPRTAQRSSGLQAAAKAAGLNPEIETIRLSDMPGIAETYNVVDSTLSDSGDEECVVNFTGGTKLMSIGAFAAAQARKAPSIYVDTQDACFVDGNTSPVMGRILDGDWSFTPIRKQLRVDVLGIANGVPRITSGKPWKPMLALAQALFDSMDDEGASHAAIHGPDGLFPRGMEPRSPLDWLAALDRPFQLPAHIAKLAIDAELLRPGAGDSEVFLPDQSRNELETLASSFVPDFNSRYFRAVSTIQHASAFLTGAWWEIIVCDAASDSGHFRDLRWSSCVGDRTGPDTEEDILGVDGVELLYISCKRGGAKARLLPLLEEIRARAATIGGSFNRRYLAILQPPKGKAASNLQQQAKRLGIRLITGDNVNDPNIFSR